MGRGAQGLVTSQVGHLFASLSSVSPPPCWHRGFSQLPTPENEPGGTGSNGRVFIHCFLGAGQCAALGDTWAKASEGKEP